VIRACVFDAYGTLLDFNSAVARHSIRLGEAADGVAATWRTKQLEYAWVGSLTGRHADFWNCTVRALQFALGCYDLDPGLADDLLEAYRAPDPFPDARPALEALWDERLPAFVLSNGTAEMLEGAFSAAGLRHLLQDCISIEEAGIYKPAPAAYRLVEDRTGLPADRIGFVSSNGWDAYGAELAGLRSVWVNRNESRRDYARPDKQAASLTEAVISLLAAAQR